MVLLKYLIIAAFCLLPISLVLILITNSRYTKGFWRTYIKWLMISGVLMSIYLFTTIFSKTRYATHYAAIISITGFLAQVIASITYIKSSSLLDSMANRFGFAKEKSVEHTLNLSKRKINKLN